VINLRIALVVHTPEPNSAFTTILTVATGPVFTPDEITKQPAYVSEIAHNFLTKALAELPAAVNKTLPSLPEKLDEQPRFLSLARQWLALVENGKCAARCQASELPTGERQIIITLDPKKD
jgi:hypothetical protein